MDYRQYHRARKLVHECCNYIDENCIALDDGEECVCIQSISYSLLCRWFRTAVLPQDRELETALFTPPFQPGQILLGMCRTHEADQRRKAQAETTGEITGKSNGMNHNYSRKVWKIQAVSVDKWKNDYTCRICVIRIS